MKSIQTIDKSVIATPLADVVREIHSHRDDDGFLQAAALVDMEKHINLQANSAIWRASRLLPIDTLKIPDISKYHYPEQLQHIQGCLVDAARKSPGKDIKLIWVAKDSLTMAPVEFEGLVRLVYVNGNLDGNLARLVKLITRRQL